MEDVPEIKAAIARSRANTPLLGGDWDEVEGLQAGGRDGGIRSSIYTLVSTMMGGGILSLPYAIQSAGLVLGPCLLVAVGVASRLSLWLTLTSGASLRASSYEAMVAATLGPRAAVLVTVALALLLWFVIVAYSILLGDLLTPVLAALTGGSIGGISAPRGLLSARSATMLAGHLAVLPATTRPSIGEMNGASALSLGTTTALALLISARSVIAIVARGSLLSPLAAGASGLMLPRGGARGVLNATSIIAVSFLCHFNLLPVSDELARPSEARHRKVIDRATALAGALYLCVGVLGCLQFGADGAGVRGNVLLNYAADDLSINAGRAGLALTVSIGIALMVHPLRGAVRQLLAVRSAADRGGDGGVRGVREVAEAMVYQATALLAAIFIPEIEVVWSLLGSTVCLLIGYVLPAACYLALSKWAGTSALRHHRKAQALLVSGTALTLLCTATTIAQYVL